MEKQKQIIPNKLKARNITKLAVKRGLIRKKDTCDKCGSNENIEIHHHDYSKPYKISWYCRKCHKEWHKGRKKMIGFNPSHYMAIMVYTPTKQKFKELSVKENKSFDELLLDLLTKK